MMQFVERKKMDSGKGGIGVATPTREILFHVKNG